MKINVETSCRDPVLLGYMTGNEKLLRIDAEYVSNMRAMFLNRKPYSFFFKSLSPLLKLSVMGVRKMLIDNDLFKPEKGFKISTCLCEAKEKYSSEDKKKELDVDIIIVIPSPFAEVTRLGCETLYMAMLDDTVYELGNLIYPLEQMEIEWAIEPEPALHHYVSTYDDAVPIYYDMVVYVYSNKEKKPKVPRYTYRFRGGFDVKYEDWVKLFV